MTLYTLVNAAAVENLEDYKKNGELISPRVSYARLGKGKLFHAYYSIEEAIAGANKWNKLFENEEGVGLVPAKVKKSGEFLYVISNFANETINEIKQATAEKLLHLYAPSVCIGSGTGIALRTGADYVMGKSDASHSGENLFFAGALFLLALGSHYLGKELIKQENQIHSPQDNL
ncbi:MAG: hypothetical protein ACP5N3_05395 [Candidatus Nanoarchaeia archaeon]